MSTAATDPARRRLMRRLLTAADDAAALALVRASGNLADAGTAQLVSAEFDRVARRDPRRAAAAVRAARALASRRRDPVARAYASRVDGLQAYLEGRTRPAARRLELAARVFTRAGMRREAGDVSRTLVQVLLHHDDGRAALDAGRRAAAHYRRVEADGARQADLAINVGNVHHRREEYERALQCYARARRLYATRSDPFRLAATSFNEANALAGLDRFDQARQRYGRARTVFREQRLDSLVLQVDYALAEIDLLEGDLDRSIGELQNVRRGQETLRDHPGVAHTDLAMAEAYLRLNRPDDSRRAASRAERFFRRVGHTAERAAALAVLASADLQQGAAGRATRRFARARDLHRASANRVGAALAELGRSRAALKAGHPEEALRSASAAAAWFAARGLRSRQARALSLRAEAHLARGARATARRDAVRALDLARRTTDGRVEMASLLALARIEDEDGHGDRAYRHLLRAERCVERLRRGVTTEESRLAFAQDKIEVYEALVHNRLQRGGPAAVRQALVFAERGKARALAERIAEAGPGVLGRATPATRSLVQRLESLERALSVAEARLEDPGGTPGLRSPRTQRLVSLTEERARTLAELLQHDPAHASLAGAGVPDPWQGVHALEPGETVLEYTQSRGRVHVFVVDGSGVDVVTDVARVEAVAESVDLLRFHLGKGILGDAYRERFGSFLESSVRGHLERLHEMLLAPVMPRVRGGAVRIVPHGVLHGLPFHALQSGGQALVDRFTVSYAPSLAVLGLLRKGSRREAPPPLILGVPDSAAPEIEAEVTTVTRHLGPARVFRGAEATGRAIRLCEDRPALLHVASHGFYCDDGPWSAGIRLGDAWLSLPEIYTLRGTADIVVLSGCETGRGTVYSGDEWVGLVRGFMQAGARAVVASLWELHDRSTVGLIDDFYAALGAGRPVAEALCSAQRRARASGAPCLHWAPFMVIGDATLRLSRRKAA